MTSIVGVVPSTHSVGNATAWEEDRVLTRLLSDRRCVTTGSLIRPMLEEPDPKRQKSAPLEQAEEEGVNRQGKTYTANNVEDEAEETFPLQQQSTRNGATADWWQSGDARRLFAPCDTSPTSTSKTPKRLKMPPILRGSISATPRVNKFIGSTVFSFLP